MKHNSRIIITVITVLAFCIYSCFCTEVPSTIVTVSNTSFIKYYDGNRLIDTISQDVDGPIVFPDSKNMTKEGYTFEGWEVNNVTANASTADDCNLIRLELNPNSTRINTTIINGTIKPAQRRTPIIIPDRPFPPKKIDFDDFKFRCPIKVPQNNTIVFAKWRINNYTVTFVVNESLAQSTTQEFNSTIHRPVVPVKEGFDLVLWSTSASALITPSTAVPSNNITLYAIQASKFIEIHFELKNVTRLSAQERICGVESEAVCKIEEFKEDDNGVYVIVVFTDTNQAVEYFRTLDDDTKENDGVASVRFISQFTVPSVSSAPALFPSFALFV